MGCDLSKASSTTTSSSPEVNRVLIPSSSTPQSAPPATPSQQEQYKVMVFAAFRNTHEGIRGWIAESKADVVEAMESPSDVNKLNKALLSVQTLLRLIEIHMEHEEKGLFPAVDNTFDRVAFKEGFRNEHEHDLEEQFKLKKVVEDLTKGERTVNPAEVEKFHDLVVCFGDNHIKHLEHEESILPPLTQKFLPEESRPAIINHMLHINFDRTYDFFPSAVVQQMAKRNPYPSLRMFIAALQRVLSAEDYAKILPGIKDAAGDKWPELEAHGLGGPGKFSEKEKATLPPGLFNPSS